MISAKIKKLNIKKKKFSLFSILVCTIVPLITSCSTSPLKENVVSNSVKNFFTSNLWVNSFSKVIFGYPDYPLTREMVEEIPYASLRIKIGKGPAGLMILQEKEDEKYSWVSKDSVLIKIQDGRIVRTSNLNNDLVDYYYADDIVFEGLVKGNIQLKETSENITLRDLIKGNISFKEIINLKKDKYYYSTRAISLANPVVRGLNVQVYTKKEANEVIEILDRKYEVILIKEIVENKKIAWKHENLYWVDPETGFVWKSLQQIAPNVPPISLEITKAPSI